MIYFIIKPFIRLALKIFCPDLRIENPKKFSATGPLLITANHPDSFLDAVIIGAQFDRPVHFLARGDAFDKPWHNLLLRTLHMFPIYRLSEGKEHLGRNAEAFANAKKVLGKNGIVLIFIEGICVNKNELQPFKKGAARIAQNCWQEGIPLKILPMGIAYDQFRLFGKSVRLKPGNFIERPALMPHDSESKNYLNFNEVLFREINQLIDPPHVRRNSLPGSTPIAALGRILHLPFYLFLSHRIRQKTSGTVFYDSVLFGALFLTYPFYLILLAGALYLLQLPFLLITIIVGIHPLLAYAAARNKIISPNKRDN